MGRFFIFGERFVILNKLEDAISKIRGLSHDVNLDLILYEEIKVSGIDATLNAAVICARPEIIHDLQKNHKVNLSKTINVASDRHSGETSQIGLIETTLIAYLTRPDADRTTDGQKDLFETVKYLLRQNLPILTNPDPLESPLLWAHFLANPELAVHGHPYYYLVPQCANQKAPEKFVAIYNEFKKFYPDAVKKFEKALDEEIKSLRTEMNKAADDVEQDNKGFRPIGDVLPKTPKPEEP